MVEPACPALEHPGIMPMTAAAIGLLPYAAGNPVRTLDCHPRARFLPVARRPALSNDPDGDSRMRKPIRILPWLLPAAAASLAFAMLPAAAATPASAAATPLVIGESFTLDSKTLGETRRMNVYLPPGYAEDASRRLPVLLLIDGGLGEDFLHIAGLVQVSVASGTMRPFILVGVENTQRRLDLTGPTENAQDQRIAPAVGGSAAFRRFLREELLPEVDQRYRTTAERAIAGESLGGLFVVETLLLEPALFDTYIAIDPSLWWNEHRLLDGTAERLAALGRQPKALYFASSDYEGIATLTQQFATVLAERAPPTLRWQYQPMPRETHGTIFHPAALSAFRSVLRPVPAP